MTKLRRVCGCYVVFCWSMMLSNWSSPLVHLVLSPSWHFLSVSSWVEADAAAVGMFRRCLNSFLAAFCWALRFLRVATFDSASIEESPSIAPFSLSAALLAPPLIFFLEMRPIVAYLRSCWLFLPLAAAAAWKLLLKSDWFLPILWWCCCWVLRYREACVVLM